MKSAGLISSDYWQRLERQQSIGHCRARRQAAARAEKLYFRHSDARQSGWREETVERQYNERHCLGAR